MIVKSALQRISLPNVLHSNVLRPNVCAQMSGFDFFILVLL